MYISKVTFNVISRTWKIIRISSEPRYLKKKSDMSDSQIVYVVKF